MLFQNYLKIALRSLGRNKLYSLLNIFGFALGMACCLVIMLWVYHQWSFNRFNAHLDRSYRLLRTEQLTNEIITLSALPGPLGKALKEDIPEIEHIAHTLSAENVLIAGDKSFHEEGTYANSDIFAVFSFPIVVGNPATALDQPSSIALSESLAQKLFGSANVLGATVRLEYGKTDFKVTAVFRDIPKNSSVRFDFAASVDELIAKRPWAQEWGNNSFRTFISLREGVPQKRVDEKLKDLLRKKKNDPKAAVLFSQPLSEMYLYNKFENGSQQGGRIETVRLFTIIAVLVLIIACVNFMNLTTARGIRRSKEVGIRKVVGATRTAIVRQILGESILTAILALPIALLAVELVLPALKELTGAELRIPIEQPIFWGTTLLFVFVTGCLAGLYPALALSSFNMSTVLKGAAKSGPWAAMFRRGLVILEFTIAIAFTIATLVVYRQIEFIKTKNIGINRENVVTVPIDIKAERFTAWKQELKGISSIKGVTGVNTSPLNLGNNTYGMRWRGQMPNEKIVVSMLDGDYDFPAVMDVQIKEGRTFLPQFPADTLNYIINETCARQMRLANPVGETLRWGDDSTARVGTVVGVMKDFHFSSMHNQIEPLMLLLDKEPNHLYVKLAASETEAGLEALRKTFGKYQPNMPFTFKFLDDEFNAIYKSETMVGTLSLYFASVAICICCLGLFGLAAFTAESRTKEIGIRKVLGASEGSIIVSLSRDFLILVIVAFVIACPFTWWGMSKWLQDFAYRVDLGAGVFMLAGALALMIAFATVASQAWRAARANPVNALRSE